jgi:hypothetical protein
MSHTSSYLLYQHIKILGMPKIISSLGLGSLKNCALRDIERLRKTGVLKNKIVFCVVASRHD